MLTLRSAALQRRCTRHLCNCSAEQSSSSKSNNNAFDRSGPRSQAQESKRRLVSLLELPDEPLGGYIASPRSPLHGLDPRTKQVWLAAAVSLPPGLESNQKLAFAAAVAVTGAVCLPARVWAPRVRQSATLSLLVLLLASLSAPDDAPPMPLARDVPAELAATNASSSASTFPPSPSTAYSATLFVLGPLKATRKSMSVALSASSLAFNSLECTALVQSTTKPEELAGGTRALLSPLGSLGLDVDAVTLSLLLSLRFASIVTDEMRNLAAGVAARGVSVRELGVLGTVSLAATVARKFVSNLLRHSQETAMAMHARRVGKTGASGVQPALYAATDLRLRAYDIAAFIALVPLLIASF